MERPKLRAMAAPRALAVLNTAFFFFGVRRLLEGLLRAIMHSLHDAEKTHDQVSIRGT
jgi:hypothetical protein